MRRSLASFGVVALMASTFGVIGVMGAGPAGAAPTALTTILTFEDTGGEEDDVTCTVSSVDLGTGSLTTLNAVDSDACPIDYAPRADGTIFGVTLAFSETNPSTSRLVTVDPTTGAMTDVGDTGVQFDDIGGLEFDAAGILWMVGGGNVDPACNASICEYQIDPATGAATFAGEFETPTLAESFPGGLTRTCTDPLYTNRTDFIINGEVPATDEPETGDTAPEAEAAAPAGDDVRFLGPRGDVSAAQLGEGVLATVDTATPAFNDIGPLGDTEFADGLAFASDGVLWAIVTDSLFPMDIPTYSTGTVNPATGEFTKVATLDLTFTEDVRQIPTGLTFLPDPCAPAVVPVALEPTFTG